MLDPSAMVRFLACLVVFCSLWALPRQALAREGDLVISVLTMGPGDPTFSKFGHNAILVENRRTRRGVVYNFGTFSFSSPDLISDFLDRRLNYWLSVEPLEETLHDYRRQNRLIVQQELSLTQQQAVELARALSVNARPENRLYAYDYYFDNCSTRVRDALDRTLGGLLKAAARPQASQSFREHTLRLTQDDFLLSMGLDFGLSGYADAEVSEWEESFLPERLRMLLRRVKVKDDAGVLVPLVRSERVLFSPERGPPSETGPNRVPLFAAIGSGLGLGLAALARRRDRRLARLSHAALLASIGLVAGCGGALLAFLWLGTPHQAAARNLNILIAPPWALLLLPLAFLSVRRSALAPRWGRALGLVLVGGALLGLLLRLAGLQQSERFIALLLPIWVGLLVGELPSTRSREAGS